MTSKTRRRQAPKHDTNVCRTVCVYVYIFWLVSTSHHVQLIQLLPCYALNRIMDTFCQFQIFIKLKLEIKEKM